MFGVDLQSDSLYSVFHSFTTKYLDQHNHDQTQYV